MRWAPQDPAEVARMVGTMVLLLLGPPAIGLAVDHKLGSTPLVALTGAFVGVALASYGAVALVLRRFERIAPRDDPDG